MPTGGLKTGYPGVVYDKVEMGRYYGHTYNLPLYKIPTTGKVPKHHPDEASYAGRNQMFDILEDPAQNHPMHDTARESRFIERITHHLKSCEAQTEQYTRLGISYPG